MEKWVKNQLLRKIKKKPPVSNYMLGKRDKRLYI